jgi:hypothetical protein
VRGRGLCLLGGMMIGQAAAQRQQEEYQAQQQAQQQAYEQGLHQAQQQPSPAVQSIDCTVELQKLADLHSSGVLTDQEFAAAKKKVLDL